MRIPARVAAAVLCGAVACTLTTDDGTYGMTVLGVALGASDTLEDAVYAEGTLLCFNCADVYVGGLDCSNVGACLQWQVDGTDLGPERCMPDTQPGSSVLDIVPVDCANAPELMADSRTFEWVETSRLVPNAEDYWTRLAERGVAEGMARTVPEWRADWLQPEGQAWTLVADQPYSLYVTVDDDQGRPVAWDPKNGAFDIAATGSGNMSGRTGKPYATITLSDGTAGTLRYTLNDQTWDIGGLETVRLDEVASLEIVAGLLLDPESEANYESPLAARAIARTADGRAVYGAPVTWTLDAGAILLTTQDAQEDDTGIPPLPGPDHVLLEDVCLPPEAGPSQRSATLVATVGEVSASLDLIWAVPPGDPTTFEPDPACDDLPPGPATETTVGPSTDDAAEGCNCTHASPWHPTAWSLVALLALRRRRN